MLAGAAVTAQLGILQAFLPMEGWLVVRTCAEADFVIAVDGMFRTMPQEALESICVHDWHNGVEPDGFGYRPLRREEESLRPGRAGINAGPGYLLRIDLKALDVAGNGYLVGLSPALPTYRPFLAGDVRLCLKALALTLALHAELNVAEQLMVELQRDAFLDPLTGTLNRAGWINRLAHINSMLGDGQQDAAIVMLDLDYLKQVNDTHGHSAGDDLIRLTAQTISSVLRSSDSVGRLGGDEFGVVAQHATPAVAAALVARLRHALDAMGINISIGMALKSETGSLKSTMQLADTRMYEDKRTKPAPERALIVFRDGRIVAD
jgi:diguanylate cyclase (GGDEF)-like protein